MNYLMIVTTDTNDADYMRSTGIVTAEQKVKLETLLRRIVTVGYCEDRETLPQDMYDLTQEEVEMISDWCEGGEYGYHSIESVEFYPLAGEKEIIHTNARWNGRTW